MGFRLMTTDRSYLPPDPLWHAIFNRLIEEHDRALANLASRLPHDDYLEAVGYVRALKTMVEFCEDTKLDINSGKG